MSKTLRLAHARRAGILLASGLACAAVPAVASASAVNLGTASPFVVLGASSATNTGPSVLNGDLGVSPGTSLSGFTLPAVVNGATHDDDAVAGQAQNDLATAYGVAAGQPISPGNDLTGQDLGGLTLRAGAYSFSSSAQLTGQLTLDAAGDPNAQFVFEIGSTLTTASASSVRLINGASPCNIYWQVGSSATLGTTTALMGNVLAHDSISLDDSATVEGRLLALGGAVTLIHNTIDGSLCGTSTTPPPESTPPDTNPPTNGTTPPTGGTTPPTSGTTPPTSGTTPPTSGSTPPTEGRGGAKPPPASHSTVPTRRGSATLGRTKTPTTLMQCDFGFTATVRGREIKRVVFMLDGKQLASRSGPQFSVHVPAAFAGSGHLKARVTFKDATRAQTLNLRYRACAAAVVQPLPAPSTFTG
ncbi:MAG: ice-binding family protein [Actinomycetota bacterium]|nr:ice-binding family protein [Actinomycetota bacterium]